MGSISGKPDDPTSLAIDRPAPKDKEPFTRIKAFYKSYSRGWEEVIITSLAESRYGHQEVWISRGAKGREKVSLFDVFEHSPDNAGKVKAYQVKQAQMQVLQEECRTLIASMDKITIPKDTE